MNGVDEKRVLSFSQKTWREDIAWDTWPWMRG